MSNVKNLLGFKKDGLFRQDFIDIMKMENLYIVKLSYPPNHFKIMGTPFEHNYWSSRLFSKQIDARYLDDWCFLHNINAKTVFSSTLNYYYNQDLFFKYKLQEENNAFKNGYLIVKTGNYKYVREYLTNEKIPVGYYSELKDYYETTNDCNRQSLAKDVKTNLMSGYSPMPYYIRAFNIDTRINNNVKQGSFTNFNLNNSLNNLSQDEYNKIIAMYEYLHQDIILYRMELKNKFEKLEERLNNIIKEDNKRRKEKIKTMKKFY